MNKNKIGRILITGITLIAMISILFVNPIPQDLSYHVFVD
jgi:hypothetical protein